MTRQPRTPEERRLGEDRLWFSNHGELRVWFEEELWSLVEAEILPLEKAPQRTEHDVTWGARQEFFLTMGGGGFRFYEHAYQAQFYMEWWEEYCPRSASLYRKRDATNLLEEFGQVRQQEVGGRDQVTLTDWFMLEDPDYLTHLHAVFDHFAYKPVGIRGGTGKQLVICNGFDPFDMSAHFTDLEDKLGWKVVPSADDDLSLVYFEHGKVLIPHDARLTPLMHFNTTEHCYDPQEIQKVLDGQRKMLQQFRLYLRMYRDRQNVRKSV